MIDAAIMSIFDLITYWGSLAVGMGIGGGVAWIVAVRRERAAAMKRTFRATVLHTMDDLNRAFASRPSKPLVNFDKMAEELKIPASMLRGTAPGGLLPDTWPAVRDERNERWARIAQTRNERHAGPPKLDPELERPCIIRKGRQ